MISMERRGQGLEFGQVHIVRIFESFPRCNKILSNVFNDLNFTIFVPQCPLYVYLYVITKDEITVSLFI